MSNRRSFIQQSLTAVGASLLSTQLVKAESPYANKTKIDIKPNDIILFQGDSITDDGRNRDNKAANNANAMGHGYPMVAASSLLNQFADKNIQIYNRGISGNKVPQLAERWKQDCIDLQPTILSILIGINDYWHKRNGEYQGSAADYKAQYKKLIDQTLAVLPQVKLIIGEPFAVKNVKHVDDSWFPEITAYQQAARDIAKEYNAIWIPYQEIFDKAEKRAPGSYWTTDGVHTTLAGVNLMAQAWLDAIKK